MQKSPAQRRLSRAGKVPRRKD